MYYLRRLFWLSAIFNFHITAKYIEGENNVIADTISHLHSLAYFYRALSYICRYKDIISILGSSLLCNMPFNSALFLSIRFHGLLHWKKNWHLKFLSLDLSPLLNLPNVPIGLIGTLF